MSLRARFDLTARRLTDGRLYLAYTLRGEHVGTVPDFLSLRDVRECLQSRGYERSPSVAGIPLEAAKRHPETGETHDLALRKVGEAGDDRHATAIDAGDPRHTQFHVHGFERDGRVELHSHFEWRPDARVLDGERPVDAYNRLRSHYRPGSYGDGAYLRAVHDDAVASLVTDGEKSDWLAAQNDRGDERP